MESMLYVEMLRWEECKGLVVPRRKEDVCFSDGRTKAEAGTFFLEEPLPALLTMRVGLGQRGQRAAWTSRRTHSSLATTNA